MNAPEVVPHEVQRNAGGVVLDLLRERVREPSEAAHAHPHCEVLAFDIAGIDVLRVGVTDFAFFLARRADGGAVPLLPFGIVAVNFHQHGIINIFTESIRYRRDVHFETIDGQLDAIGETAGEVLNELRGATRIALAYQPRAHQLGIGIEGDPGPSASDAMLVSSLLRDIFVLRTDEAPNLVALNPLGGQIAEYFVLILRASRANFHQQLRHGVLSDARHADSRADRIAFDQAPDYLSLAGGIKAVHIDHYA